MVPEHTTHQYHLGLCEIARFERPAVLGLGLLLNNAEQQLNREFERAARPHGLTLLQWRVLGALAAEDRQIQKSLATRLEASLMSISDVRERQQGRLGKGVASPVALDEAMIAAQAARNQVALAVGALQMLLDRGEAVAWFASAIYLRLSISGLWVFIVHCRTAADPCVDLRMFRDRNLVMGFVFMFLIGMTLFSGLALLQRLMGYSVVDPGLVMAPSGRRGQGKCLVPAVEELPFGAAIQRHQKRGRQRDDPPRALDDALFGGVGGLHQPGRRQNGLTAIRQQEIQELLRRDGVLRRPGDHVAARQEQRVVLRQHHSHVRGRRVLHIGSQHVVGDEVIAPRHAFDDLGRAAGCNRLRPREPFDQRSEGRGLEAVGIGEQIAKAEAAIS